MNGFRWNKWYFFQVADHESEVMFAKFKFYVVNMWKKKLNYTDFDGNWNSPVLLGRWSRIWSDIWKIHNGKFEMLEKSPKHHQILIEISIWKFFFL